MAGAIFLRYEIPSQNVSSRKHWSWRAKDIREATLMIRVACQSGVIPPAIAKRRVIITSYRRTLITDQANLVGGCKNLVDAMVHAKILKDDSDTFARIEYQQFTCRQVKDAALAFPDMVPRFPQGMRGKPCTHILVEEDLT